jgi:hypothetical protein
MSNWYYRNFNQYFVNLGWTPRSFQTRRHSKIKQPTTNVGLAATLKHYSIDTASNELSERQSKKQTNSTTLFCVNVLPIAFIYLLHIARLSLPQFQQFYNLLNFWLK